MSEHLQLPEPVLYTMERIIKNGGEAWLVGGALRDFLLNRTVSDFDIATSFTPDIIKNLFSEYNMFTVGKRFGTITVIVDDMPIEITTFRGESGYSDRRHPDAVIFLNNIEDDLARRDFSINAMAYCPFSNSPFIDPFNGKKALENKIIETVNDPYDRFSEDPLRMLRAIRFSAQLGFKIEQKTFDAIKQLNHLITSISAERIREELFKILESPFIDSGLKSFKESGMLSLIIQSATKKTGSRFCSDNEIDETKAISNNEVNDYGFLVNCADNLAVKMCAFLYHELNQKGLNVEEAARAILKYLRCDNRFLKTSAKLISSYEMIKEAEPSAYSLRKVIGFVGSENIYDLIKWHHAYHSFKNPNKGFDFDKKIKSLYIITDAIIENKDPLNIRDLAIDGNDIIKLGIGADDRQIIGQALNTALKWVLNDPTLNKKNILEERLVNKFHYKKRTDSDDRNS